eukprot:7881268-Pyramimonas_sp.AAC.1
MNLTRKKADVTTADVLRQAGGDPLAATKLAVAAARRMRADIATAEATTIRWAFLQRLSQRVGIGAGLHVSARIGA